MVTVWNGSPGNRPARRLRFDGHPARQSAGAHRDAATDSPDDGHSGRQVVIVALAAILALAVTLALLFRDWRDRYRIRAAYGATQVATVIDDLALTVPPDVSRDAWRGCVLEAHAMLVTLTASNMLDLHEMRALRDDLATRVARARAQPETARAELAALWEELARRAGPNLVKRHPRPRLLTLQSK